MSEVSSLITEAIQSVLDKLNQKEKEAREVKNQVRANHVKIQQMVQSINEVTKFKQDIHECFRRQKDITLDLKHTQAMFSTLENKLERTIPEITKRIDSQISAFDSMELKF